MVQLFSPTRGSQELIAVVGSALHKSEACCIAYRQGPGKGNSELLNAPPALGTRIRSRSNQPKGPIKNEKKQVAKLESFSSHCLMRFDFVPSAILVIMSPSLSVPDVSNILTID